MDYEKKYKEALELARVAAFNGHQSLMEGIFPELAESKDEKTRKRIIALVNAHGQGMYKDDMLAWLENIPYTIDHEKREGFHLGYKAGLEKQGEQSSLNINRECLKGIKRVQEYQDLSDWEKEFDNIASMYAHNKNQEGYNDSWYVKERAAEMLYYAKKELEKQGEQKPKRMISAEAKESLLHDKYEGLTDFERTLADICIGWIGEELGWKQYIKDNADVLLKIAVEKFNSVQDVPFEQKHAWSEEDEEILKLIKFAVSNLPSQREDTRQECLDWLKFLKDRVQPTITWNENDEVVLESAATKYAQDKYLPVQTAQAFKAGARWILTNLNTYQNEHQ